MMVLIDVSVDPACTYQVRSPRPACTSHPKDRIILGRKCPAHQKTRQEGSSPGQGPIGITTIGRFDDGPALTSQIPLTDGRPSPFRIHRKDIGILVVFLFSTYC